MSIRVLGPVSVDAAASLRPRDLLVIGALAARAGRVLAPEEIADAVWAGRPPATWHKQVQICVTRLRRALPAGAIETSSGGGYRLVPGRVDIDVEELESLVARGRSMAASGEPDRAATALTRALSLVRGEPYRSIEHWPPAAAEAARLTELIRAAQDDLLDARLAVGGHREVASEAEALVAQDPLRERRWAALALAQYRCGRQADALRTLRQARAMLAEQLGIDPGPQLARLEEQVLRQAPELHSPPARQHVSPDCPYKGLAPLEAGDAMFGRDTEIADCLARIADQGVLVIAGPSGSGKSSLVRAGLLPALRRRGLRCRLVVCDPGIRTVMPDDDAGVMIVDQFEHALAGDAERARLACAELVAYATSRGPVVVVVRADHLAGLAVDPRLSRLAEQNLHLLAPPRGDALRAAIELPALEAGYRLEPGLVELVLRDAEGEPGALPLLSHALAETWQRRDGVVLTVAAYRAAGGISGAVARSADRLFESLIPDARHAVRWLLLRLVTPSAEGEPMRCRVPSRSLRGDALREEVLARLVDARLVTAADGVVEISHESLVRAWPRLRSWLDEDEAGVRVVRHLATTAEGWEALGRPDSELYRGGRLELAREYCAANAPDLSDVEREFLDASRRQAASEHAALEARARLDRRRNQRLRALLVTTVTLLVVATAGGVSTVRSAQDAREAAAEATVTSLLNQSLALRSTDRDVAALLAVETYRRWPDDPRALSALVGTFTASTGFVANTYVADAAGLRGAVVPDTRTAVVARDGLRPFLLDLDSGRALRELTAPGDPPDGVGLGVVVAAAGNRAAELAALPGRDCDAGAAVTSEGFCGELRILDLVTGAPHKPPVPTPDGAWSVAMSDDGTLVAVVGSEAGTITVYDAGTGAQHGLIPSSDGAHGPGAVTFGPDGRLYAGSRSGVVRAIDPTTGEVVATMELPAGYSDQHLRWGSGGTLVAGGPQGLAALDVEAGQSRWQASLTGGSPDPCPWLAVAPATERLYCGTRFGEIEERDLADGSRTGRVLDIQHGDVGDLAVSPDGAELVVFGAATPAVTRWRLDGSGPVSTRIADGYAAADRFGYGSDSDTLLVARRPPNATLDSDFTDVALWSVSHDVLVDDIPPDAQLGIGGMGWAGPGLLTGLDLATLRFRWYDVASRSLVDGPDFGVTCDHLWPTADGERAYCGGNGVIWTIDIAARMRTDPTIPVYGGWARSVSATRGAERIVITYETSSGERTVVVDGRTGRTLVGPVAGPDLTGVSLDGTLYGASHGKLTRYDLDTLQPTQEIAGAHGEINTLQYSDDGRILLATSNDQSAALYDAATGTRLGDPIPTSAPFIYPAYLSPDGDTLAVTDADGVVVWNLAPEHLVEAACRVAGRNLTTTEWSTYVGGTPRETCPPS